MFGVKKGIGCSFETNPVHPVTFSWVKRIGNKINIYLGGLQFNITQYKKVQFHCKCSWLFFGATTRNFVRFSFARTTVFDCEKFS